MNSNEIISHITYKVKTEENISKRLKSRIFPHVNRDILWDKVRKYYSKAQLYIIRLMLIFTTLLDNRMGLV